MPDDLSAQLEDILGTFETIAQETEALATTALASHLHRVNRALYCLLGVFMPSLYRWATEKRALIWHDSAPKRVEPSFVFVGLLANLINSTLAVRKLTITGFDRQARAIFRELTEVGDLLLVIVADEDYLDRYIDSPAEDFAKARQHWDTHFRPWKVRQRVKAAAQEVGFDNMWKNPEAVWRAHWDLYAWLSKFAHIDYGALAIESVAADTDGRRNINIGGRIGSHSTATLRHLTDYLRDLLTILAFLLADRHCWSADDPDLHAPLLAIREFAVLAASAPPAVPI